MSKIVKILSIVLVALLVVLEFVLLTDEISDQRKEINKLKDKVKYIEINYQLDEYNKKQLQEYYNGEL